MPILAEETLDFLPAGDPTAGGNDNLYLSLLKDKAAEAGLIQKPAAQKNPQQAQKEEDEQDLELDPEAALQKLLELLAEEHIELTDADHEYTEGLPESVKNARSRRQVQIAVQTLLMLQIQAYFQMQIKPQSFPPQQLIATQRLIAQLMQLMAQRDFSPEALKNLPILKDPAALAAVTQLRQQLQDTGLAPRPLRTNELMLQMGQKVAGHLTQELQNLQNRLQGMKGAETLTAEAQKLRLQLALLQGLRPDQSPAQTLLAIVQQLRQNGQMAMTQAQLKTLIANINNQASKAQLMQLVAQLTRQSLLNVQGLQQRLTQERYNVLLPPETRRTLNETAPRLLNVIQAAPAVQWLQNINEQLRQHNTVVATQLRPAQESFNATPLPAPQPRMDLTFDRSAPMRNMESNAAPLRLNPETVRSDLNFSTAAQPTSPLRVDNPAIEAVRNAFAVDRAAARSDLSFSESPAPVEVKREMTAPVTEQKHTEAVVPLVPQRDGQNNYTPPASDHANQPAAPETQAAKAREEAVQHAIETGQTQRILDEKGRQTIITAVPAPAANFDMTAWESSGPAVTPDDLKNANNSMNKLGAQSQNDLANAMNNTTSALTPDKGWIKIDPNNPSATPIPPDFNMVKCPATGVIYAVPPQRSGEENNFAQNSKDLNYSKDPNIENKNHEFILRREGRT